jgi:hypothetical protein
MDSLLPFLLRLAARMSTIFLAGLYFLILAGEFYAPHAGAPTEFREWAGIFLLTACVAGMIVAWRHELPGALLSLLTLIAFGFVVHIRNYALLFVVAVPALLYLADWVIRRQFPEHHAAT